MMIARCAMRALLAAIALSIAGTAAAAAPAKCAMARVAEWQVRPTRGQPIIDGTINGHNVGIMLDTGASRTVIVRSTADRLGLVRYDSRSNRIMGVGGETAAETVSIDTFAIGADVRHDLRLLVAGEHALGSDIAVILGEDFFRQVDIEFDLAHNAIRLFQVRACDGASLAYWTTEGAGAVDLEGSGAPSAIEFTVAINGRPVPAILDSGAFQSVVTKWQAAALGITPDSAGVVTVGCNRGLGQKAIEVWLGPFETFRIGDEVVRDPHIQFADLWKYSTVTETGSRIPIRSVDRPEMLLGADFLRSHRVLVAHSQRKMYFTYSGGAVFPTSKTGPCSTDEPQPPSGAR